MSIRNAIKIYLKGMRFNRQLIWGVQAVSQFVTDAYLLTLILKFPVRE